MGDFISTANGLIALITALVGLIGTAAGAFFTIRGFIKASKEKTIKENWNMIMAMADAAMKEAEASGKKGKDKKAMVISSVKAACKVAGIDIGSFIDQLDAYIDQCISFVNEMSK